MRTLLRSLLTGTAILVLTAAMGLWGPAEAQAGASCAAPCDSLPGAAFAMAPAAFEVHAGRGAR